MTTKHRIFTISFASVYPLYVAKAEKKGRKKSEVDAVICWLTGYNQKELAGQLKKQKDFETFFKQAPRLNPSRTLIKGVICGVRVEDIQEPLMREIRYLDRLVDELAKGKAMDKILRTQPTEPNQVSLVPPQVRFVRSVRPHMPHSPTRRVDRR